MLSEREALAILKKYNSSAEPQKIITFNGLYLIFAVSKDDPFEGDQDPYYSVDMNTGAVRDYSIYQDGKAKEIVSLFVKAPNI